MLCTLIFLVHSSNIGHLGGFQFSDIKYNAEMETCAVFVVVSVKLFP